MRVQEGKKRVVIEGVRPEIDCGRFPIKRVAGETVVVEADIFTDGHDALAAFLRYWQEDAGWAEVRMQPLANDRWRGEFPVTKTGHYRYTIRAWIDRFATWQRDLAKKVEAGLDVSVELQMGAEMVARAARRSSGPDRRKLRQAAGVLEAGEDGADQAALDPELTRLMDAVPDRRHVTSYGRELRVVVDRERARFSTWYELFPRSTSLQPRRHGTFKDLEARLKYVSGMGFDVLYLPPIHPIGRSHRKGKNNVTTPEPGAPGSPWAIGSEEGGHTEVHPDLGTIEDFERLVERAQDFGLEVAMDLAYQCSPDHPWVRKHPQWFRHRPDGTIQYAENPPKKYQDIYPLDFETEAWRELWDELKYVVDFWIGHGIRIFRVDNPHTKPFTFWEWLIDGIKAEHPEVIFLAEAFTRPKVMYRLAKLGFTQSYTYFAWRNAKWELESYFTELTQTDVAEFFRPNLWPNTPDILTERLQTGGQGAFMARIILAATLGASYGIYGPAYELMEHAPLETGSEEYLDSEKYEVRQWDLDRPDSLAEFIARLNRIRRDNAALQTDRTLRFHQVENEELIAYSKSDPAERNLVITVVNLDPHNTQGGWLTLPLESLGLEGERPFQVHDLLTEARYIWQGPRHYVELNPHVVPAHVFRIRQQVRTEQDFEYFA
ncbi:MAG TPA: alpha-1,4-glucan--maltose-1-phosphate maltosyltransferase [Actinomycetota bacterium]